MTSPMPALSCHLFDPPADPHHDEASSRGSGLLRRLAAWLTACMAALLLAACGGGSDGVILATAPGIAAQPASVSVRAGEAATFSVVASGSGPLSYQWRKNGTAIAGATADSYRLAAAAAADSGAQYSVVVGNSAGSVTSDAATLTVNAALVAPALTQPPVARTVTAGSTATFSVVATGSDPLTYQWRRNGTAIAGATAASYTTPAAVAADDGASFTVVVSNAAGSATSDAVRLTVTPAPVAPRITAQPAATAVTAGQTATFMVAADGTAPLTYQWKRNGADIPGATAASYTTAVTTVAADNGVRFSVVVNNPANAPVTSADAVLTVGAAPVAVGITTQPGNVNVIAGQAASFTVVAAGTAPQYQWQRDGVAIAGATSPTYTIANATVADSGARFRVVVSNGVNSVTSDAATLTVGAMVIAPTIATQPASAAVTAPGTATFTVTANGTAPFSYQWRRNGVPIAGATAASHTTPATTVAGDNGALYSVVVTNSAGSATSGDAVLTVNASSTAPTIATQPAATTATAGQTATFSVVAGGTGPLSYQWRRNGTAIAGATAASYTTPALTAADNGAQYSVVVTNAVGSVTSTAGVLTVAAVVAPAITSQPASATVLNGAAVSFSVTATGSAPLAYQWRKNGTDITGATAATYTIPAVTFFEDGATYTVVVSNASATRATSNGATLTVTLPPSTVVALATGSYHSLALRSDGTVFSWASWDRFNSVLANLDGVGNTASSSGAAVRAKNVDGTPVLDAVAVSAGVAHSVIARRDRTVWAWGQSSSVQQACPIGDGVCVDRSYPTQVKDANGVPLADVVQVNAGNYSTLAVKTDGSVWAWGRNDVGQLGNGTFTLATNPVPVRAAAGGNLTGVTAVALGDTHALALKSDGTVLAWGRNANGQLGNGAPSSSSALPVTVEIAPGIALSNVIAVAVGDEHSLALRSDNTVWAWGYNREGALGDGTTVSRSRAVQVRDVSGTPLAGITAVAAGNDHSLFLKADGTVMAAGANNQGQLGDNTTAGNQTNAVFVRDAANNVFGGVVQIESTADHAIVRRSDGSVWAWGRNDYRQLGDTTTVTRRNPVAVPAGS